MTSEQRHELARRTEFWAKSILYALSAWVVVGVCVVIVIQGYQLQSARTSLHILVDCTTPKGKCYKQGRDASSGAIGTINRVTIAAAACANQLPHPVTQEAMQACVAKAIGQRP